MASSSAPIKDSTFLFLSSFSRFIGLLASAFGKRDNSSLINNIIIIDSGTLLICRFILYMHSSFNVFLLSPWRLHSAE